MAITRILVPAKWDAGDGKQTAIAEFKLGMGPCGKNVIALNCELRPEGIFITQTCEAGYKETKDFFYPAATLTGRVEITRTPYVPTPRPHYSPGYSAGHRDGFAAGVRTERREQENKRKWWGW